MNEPSSLLTLKHQFQLRLLTVLACCLALATAIALVIRYAIGFPPALPALVVSLGYGLTLIWVPWLAQRNLLRGQPSLEQLSWLVLLGMLLTVGTAAWHSGGLRAPALMALPLLPILSALLLNRRSILPWLAAIGLTLLLLRYARSQDWISPFPLSAAIHQQLYVGMLLLLTLLCAALGWYCDRHNELLQRQLSHWAHIDGLTGVANRRFFDEQLRQEWQRNQRIGSPLSLLLVDIDHFKRYNDTHGHLQGDRCLTAIAGAIAAHSRRSGELVARYGGEEFGVILPHVDLAAAAAIAELLRQDIAQLEHPHLLEPVTVSIGFASTIPQRQITIENLINQADQALYQAKRAGRNQSVGAQVLSSHSQPSDAA